MRRHRQIPIRELKHEIKKVKCGNPTCERMIMLFNSLNPYCSAGCKVSHQRAKGTFKYKKVSETANKRAIKPIKQISDKRAIQLKEYSKLRKQFLKENPKCAVYPYLKAVEIHHTYPGSNRNRYFLEVSTWMAVSREGHNFIHSNVSLSKERGYLK